MQSRKNANYGFVNYASAIKYNSSGAVEKMRLGNGRWETAQYNNRLQVTQMGLGVTDADQNLLKLEFGYGNNTQNNGSMRSQKISFSGLSQAFEQTYAYDDLNRLLSAEEKIGTATNWKETFQYDRFGNRTFDAANTTTLLQSNNITNPTIDIATNRFSSGQNYVYDKNGNLTNDAEGRKFFYDAENHQIEVQNSANQQLGLYQYDGEGRRVRKISSTEMTVFVYNADGTLVAEYSTQMAQTQQVSYLTQDHLGSPRVITNENGAVTTRQDFSAFGEETLTAQRTQGLGYKPDSIRQDYTGYQKDEESGGLEFAQARYYNTKHGRFTSIDPLTASANVKDPQTFNRYSYVLNSPYKFTDPLGLISSSTGANGHGSEPNGKKCDIICRVEMGVGSKRDLMLLQWHVANGTALGYRYQNAAQSRFTQQGGSSQANERTVNESQPSPARVGQNSAPIAEGSTGVTEENTIVDGEVWYIPDPVDDPESLIGQPTVQENKKLGTQCVALCKIFGKLPATPNWRAAGDVFGRAKLKPGTLIATFDENGLYASNPHGNHAAIYLSQDATGIWVVEQWAGLKTIQKRHINLKPGKTDPSNNARAFSVIAIRVLLPTNTGAITY